MKVISFGPLHTVRIDHLTLVVKSAGSPDHSSSFPPFAVLAVPGGPLPFPSPAIPSVSPALSALRRFVRDGPAPEVAALDCLGRLLFPEEAGTPLGEGDGPSTGGMLRKDLSQNCQERCLDVLSAQDTVEDYRDGMDADEP